MANLENATLAAGCLTEACQIEFDPIKTSYEALVKFFYKIHDPTKVNVQHYRSAIFCHPSEQKN
jgi:peptide methionine sulfoxide reductase MsrA